MSSNPNTSNVQVGDMIIYVTGKGNTVKYIVDVTTPTVRTGRAAVATQAEVWSTPSWLYIEGDAQRTIAPDDLGYASVFYKVLWDQRQISYTVPFKFYGSSTPDASAVAVPGNDSALTGAFSNAGVAKGSYIASVTVPYADAVKAGVQPWVAPGATDYAMFKWDGSSAWAATSYPGVPTTTDSIYLVIMKDTGNYYICKQSAEEVTVTDLATNRPDLVHVYKSGSDTHVVIMDTSLTLQQLQDILYDASVLKAPVVVSATNADGTPATNMGQPINGLLANGGALSITGATRIFYGPGSTFVQVSYDPRTVTVTTNTGALAVPNNSWIDKSAGLKVTPASGYKITAITVTGGSVTSDLALPNTNTNTVTTNSANGRITITAVALGEQDRVNNAYAALRDTITLNSVALPNSIYKTGADVNQAALDAYKAAVAQAVKADVESKLAAAGYNGISATVTVTNSGTATASNIPTPGSSNSVTVNIQLNSTSVPTAVNTVTGKSISVMIGFEGQNAVETAINAALISGVNKSVLTGDSSAAIADIINGVAGVSNATAKASWVQGSGLSMVTVEYTYTWNGVSYSATANFGVDFT